MKIFLDTANIEEIEKACETGLVDGVTTNPSLLSKEARDPVEHIKKIAEIVNGPVSVEVTATRMEEMVNQARSLAELSPHVVIKIPLTRDGVATAYKLVKEGLRVNITLIFAPSQAVLAMKTGAEFISPFIGRLDDISHDGIKLIDEIVTIRRNFGFSSKIIAASIRHPLHFVEVAKRGADVATVPPTIFWQLFNHPLTDIGLKKFLEDWSSKFKREVI